MEKCRKKGNQARRKTENTMYLQAIQSEGLMVHSECNLSMTGPCAATLIKESIKEEPR